jgi:uncharacterized protein YcfJ
MKKLFVLSLGAMLLLSSCGTYTETGATTGAWFGSIIGSAIGGISGGPRGSDIGTLIGMAGGAAVGAAVGQAADEAHQKKMEEYHQRRMDRQAQRQPEFGAPDNAGYDAYRPDGLEIRHTMLLDTNRDQVLSRGEEARVVFEVFNTTDQTLYRIRPNVTEVTGNRHIEVSDNVMIESIAPGKGIRYTALVRADNALRDGEAVFRIGVFQGHKEIVSQTREFRIQTSKR